MQEYKVSGHISSFLPDGKKFKLVFSDEFDGDTLDRTKWAFRTSMMNKKHPAWVEDGVSLDGNGNLVFTVVEKDGKPVSAQLQTGFNFMDEPVEETKFNQSHLQWNIGKLHENLFTKKYGYFECRCRLQQKPGWWSAFWLQSPIIGSTLHTEISGSEVDIMESFRPGVVHSHAIVSGGYGLDAHTDNVGGLEVDKTKFHTFAVLWDKTGYTFYVDGKEDGRITENISGFPEFILISTEVRGYRHEKHEPTEESYAAIGDTFLVDYVRVFDIEE